MGCFNAISIVKAVEARKNLAIDAPGLAPFASKCYGGTLNKLFFDMRSGKRRTILSETLAFIRETRWARCFSSPLRGSARLTSARASSPSVSRVLLTCNSLDDAVTIFLDLTVAVVEGTFYLKSDLGDMGACRKRRQGRQTGLSRQDTLPVHSKRHSFRGSASP